MLLNSTQVSFNIFTDGDPSGSPHPQRWGYLTDPKAQFEKSIQELTALDREHPYQVFLTINLCTEADEVVDYYNGLDKKIGPCDAGGGASGVDVIDDLERESKEVAEAGNQVIRYSERLHICRMAGCFNPIADSLDEKQLDAQELSIAVNQILKIPNDQGQHGLWTKESIPGSSINGLDAYLEVVEEHNRLAGPVYDWRGKRLVYKVDVGRLKFRLWQWRQWEKIRKLLPFPLPGIVSDSRFLHAALIVLLLAVLKMRF